VSDSANNALMLEILKQIQRDLSDQRRLLLSLVEYVHRLEQRSEERFTALDRRLSNMKDDIELMVKAELMGRLTHFETQMDERIAQLSDRVAARETQP
jgi:hypothetical protein